MPDHRLASGAKMPDIVGQAPASEGRAILVTGRYPARNGSMCRIIYVAQGDTGSLDASSSEEIGCAPPDHPAPPVDVARVDGVGFAGDFVIGTVPSDATSVRVNGTMYNLDSARGAGPRGLAVSVSSASDAVEVLEGGSVVGSAPVANWIVVKRT
jgi:hypothetical protein